MLSVGEVEMIGLIIRRYKENFSGEWNLWLQARDQKRKALNDEEFGMLKDKSGWRYAGSIPERLDTQLRLFKSDYLEKDNAVSFFRAFPVFKIAQKI